MEGSREIRGINCISKPTIIFHKYGNSVSNSTKLHICYGGRAGALTKLSKKKKKKKKNEKRETKISFDPQRKHSSQAPYPLHSDPLRLLWPQWLLGLASTRGSRRTLDEVGRRSRACHLEPLGDLHRCCV